MRHQVDDRDLLARRVGLGRLYLYLFEVRDLLQLEGMRRAGERYDAAQHLVSERALCEHALRMQLAPRLAAVRWWRRLICRDESAQQSRGGCSATGAVSHFTTHFTATDIRVVSTGGVVQHYAGIYLVLLTHIQDPD